MTPETFAPEWVADSGHAWLIVPLASCEGVRVSPYSYRDERAGLAYLEEDCDAFAWLARHPEFDPRAIPLGRDYDGDAPCRSLPRFPGSRS